MIGKPSNHNINIPSHSVDSHTTILRINHDAPGLERRATRIRRVHGALLVAWVNRDPITKAALATASAGSYTRLKTRQDTIIAHLVIR